MPEIATIGGIRITMYYDDHNPPHFHVEYGEQKAVMHQNELMENWNLARQDMPLKRIVPYI